MEKSLSLSQKQSLALKLLDDPQIVDILFGGGAGGGKSMLVCLWMVMQCRSYPGIRIGLGRKEITKLKQTTVITLLGEAHRMLNVLPAEFSYSQQGGLIKYGNGSSIQLVDLARQPSDPNYDSLGSQNFTHVVIEEAGEIVGSARDVFISRKNRFMNGDYNIVGKSISTCNPSQNYLKQEYYKPYKKLGGGEYQKWEFGKVEVAGKMKTSYRAFIRSLAVDNPFLPRNYIEVLKKLPDAERRRLLEGNWDFEDNDAMLFKSSLLDRSMTDEVTTGDKFIGVDLADTGNDKTIVTMMENGIFTEQFPIDVDDKDESIGDQIALAIIKYAQQNGFEPSDARRIAIDGIGIGATTRDALRSRGWYVSIFIAGGKTTGNFKNLRGETIYGMSQEMDKGKLKIFSRLKTLDIFREQLMAYEYSTEERTIMVKFKQAIKEVLGVSPDYAESAYIAFWCSKGQTDPKRDSSRIMF